MVRPIGQTRTPRRIQRRRAADDSFTSWQFERVRNPFAPIEPLSSYQLDQLENAALQILAETGIDFLHPRALELWDAAGARVDWDSQHVWIDEPLLNRCLDTVPASFLLRARNPERHLTVGGNHINFVTVGGAPFYSDLENGRGPGTLAAFERMVRLAQQCGPIHIIEGLMLEPQDRPVQIRHLEKAFAQFTLADKAITTAAHGEEVAEDYVQMAAIVFGGLNAVHETPVFASVVNANSPLRYDDRMLGGLLTYAKHRQPVIVTPFILAGAMSPVTMAAAVAQQHAEALAGIALTQLVQPGTPAVYGGFTTNIDMQSGSPAFGTPEGALALLCGAQLARRRWIPYRGSGGLNNSKLPDAQASYETQMSLWPAVMGHSNIIMHSAGWLDAGLVCSMEKFIIDVEGLAIMQSMLRGFEINEHTLALGDIAEIGPGGHHFGTEHTLSRFRTAHYRPVVSDRNNYGKWSEDGALDTAGRAHVVAQSLLAAYERPALPAQVEQELLAYVTERKAELGFGYE